MAQKCPKVAIFKIETPFFEGQKWPKIIKMTVLSRGFSRKIGQNAATKPSGLAGRGPEPVREAQKGGVQIRRKLAKTGFGGGRSRSAAEKEAPKSLSGGGRFLVDFWTFEILDPKCHFFVPNCVKILKFCYLSVKITFYENNQMVSALWQNSEGVKNGSILRCFRTLGGHFWTLATPFQTLILPQTALRPKGKFRRHFKMIFESIFVCASLKLEHLSKRGSKKGLFWGENL